MKEGSIDLKDVTKKGKSSCAMSSCLYPMYHVLLDGCMLFIYF
jgi:hypothetical protein